jgi:hypothetical protein
VRQSTTVHEGDEATRSAPGGKPVYLVPDVKDWNAMLDAEKSRDPEEMKQLLANAKVIREDSGTVVKALKRDGAAVKVRIRGGDHPTTEAWAKFDYLHKLN